MNTLLRILVLTTIAALPLYVVRFSLGPLPSTLLEILLLATVLVWGIEKIKNRSAITPLPRALTIIGGLFLLAATIGIVVAPDTRAALGLWRAYFIEPIVFFIIVRDLLCTQRLKQHDIIASLALGALGVSLYAMFQRFTGFGIPHPWNLERRVTSIFPFPNAVGLFLAPLVPLFISQALAALKKPRSFLHFTFYIFNSLFCVLAIYFAHSMGAIVGVGGGVVIAGMIYLAKTRRWRTFAATVLAITILGITLLQIKPLRNELLLKDWSGTVRKIGWRESVQMLSSRPIFGAGLSGFPAAITPYHKATFLEIFQYPHNIFLNFWTEIGLLGLLSFLGLIAIFYIYAFKKIRTTYYVLPAIAAMTVILIHGLVDVPYFKNDLAIVFWLIYALGISVDKVSLKD